MEKDLKNLNQTQLKQNKHHAHQCCTHTNKLCNSQIDHLINIIKQRYISPYKIIYMINQQQADLFKLRNQNSGCCSSSSITIPKHQMTKTQLFLSQTINQCLKLNNLNIFLEQMSDKFDNIVKSGQKQNLNVDDQVEKFLMEKVMSEGINLKIYKIVIQKIKKENQSINNSAMLWATPNTWYSRYPNTPLDFLSQSTLSNLNSQKIGFAIQRKFLHQYKDQLHKELKLLEQDGKFQQLLWVKNQQNWRNDKKIMNFPQNYAFDGSQQGYQQGQLINANLKKSLLTLRSIPFQLNKKMNSYCTISQNNTISYFKSQLFYKVDLTQQSLNSRYTTFCLIGNKNHIKFTVKHKIRQQQGAFFQEPVSQGDLIIIDNNICQSVQISSTGDSMFLFKSWICTLAKKQ